MSGVQTIDKGLENIARFKAKFGVVDSNLISVRRDKVNTALTALGVQIRRLAAVRNEGLALVELNNKYKDLQDRSTQAFNINNAAQCRDALEVVKADARKEAELSVQTVDDFIKDWNIVDEQRTKARYIVGIARRVKVGDPLEWLVKPADLIDAAIAQLNKTKTKDAQASLEQWRKDWGIFEGKALAKYKEDVLEKPLVDQDDALQKKNPDGPEVEMQKAFRDRYLDSLVGMKLTALANGVDIDQLGLSLGEALAVSEYTSGAYRDINGMLLRIPNDKRTAQREKDCNIIIEVLKQSIDKLTEWRTWPTTRGESTRFRGWDAQFKQGNTFRLKAFWSTGSGFVFEGPIQLTITGKASKSAGKNVAGLSQHPNENEILFPPGTQFKVTKREDGKDGITRASLQEV